MHMRNIQKRQFNQQHLRKASTTMSIDLYFHEGGKAGVFGRSDND